MSKPNTQAGRGTADILDLTNEAVMPRGRIVRRRLAGPDREPYYLYVPSRGGAGCRVLVSVHGISRNAEEHATAFADFAERYGVVLIAPLFERNSHPRYQRLGRAGAGARADRSLLAMLDEVAALTGASTECIFLFGFSGGAQFAHRFAFAHPHRVASMVLGAAGWYTSPDPALRYPYGLDTSHSSFDLAFDLERLLGVPACVLVGERDTRRNRALKQTRRLDKRQGDTRIDRAHKWVRRMTRAARAHQLETTYLFDILPRTNHSFRRAVSHGQLGERVFCFMFGARRACVAAPSSHETANPDGRAA